MMKHFSVMRRALLCALLLFTLPAFGLTTEQLAALKASIAADATLNALPNDGDGPTTIAEAYNKPAAPAFIVWKTNVSILATGAAFNGAEWAAMTTGNHTRLQTVAQYLAAGYNASPPDIRAMFNDIWSGAGGVTTRANLLVLWKRSATRAEKLFATGGSGSDAAPSTLTFEGTLSPNDVYTTRTQ